MSTLIDLERLVAADGLEKYLERLIAEKEHLRPQEVTEEYIRNTRDQRMYPSLRYEVDSSFGGYSTTGLEVLTGNEIAAAARRMEEAGKTYTK